MPLTRRCKNICPGVGSDEQQHSSDNCIEINNNSNNETSIMVQEDEETAPIVSRARTPSTTTTTSEDNIPRHEYLRLWRKCVQTWAMFYSGLFLLWIVVFDSATEVVYMMHWAASVVAWFMFVSLKQVMMQRKTTANTANPSNNRATAATTATATATTSNAGSCDRQKVFRMLFAFLLALTLGGFTILPTSNIYSGIFHWIKPCRKLENIIHQLRYESTLSQATTAGYIDRYRPLQAVGLGNGYMKDLGQALSVHFDRYSRNETTQFDYVNSLNLIGNIFDDKGAEYLVQALEHPHAYTTQLLVGRNLNIGDKTAVRFAQLITTTITTKQQQHSIVDGSSIDNNDGSSSSGGGYRAINSSPTSTNLMWLELGGTAVTADGLAVLYNAMETRPFEFLGLEYMDKILWKRLPWLWIPNPIPTTVQRQDLHNAKLLQGLELTGNTLGNHDMAPLVEDVLQTNITRLTLINNRIGTDGVSDLLPLTNHLTELELGINRRIGDEAAILLANALKDSNNNTTLERLSLFNCNIGQSGADALLAIFPDNKKLKYLSLGGGGTIRQESLQALKDATAANY